MAPAVERFETRQLLSGLGGTAAVVSQAEPAPVNQVLTPTGIPKGPFAARLRFAGGFNGFSVTGPGRTTTEARQYYLRGVGSTTGFLHGDHQTRIIIPTDPGTPATGVMTMFDRNINNGAILGLELTSVPGDVDRFGRPTRFTFTVSDALSGGTYAAAQGQGTVDIFYGTPSGKPNAQVPASVIVRGSVYSTGTTNIIVNSDINS